jgi:hypothetical protein
MDIVKQNVEPDEAKADLLNSLKSKDAECFLAVIINADGEAEFHTYGLCQHQLVMVARDILGAAIAMSQEEHGSEHTH